MPNSKIQCLFCGDVIESTHTHDFKQCKCTLTFVDGGADYIRCGSIDLNRIRTLDGPGFEEPLDKLPPGEGGKWLMDDPALFLAVHVVRDQWAGNGSCPHCGVKREDGKHQEWCVVNFAKDLIRDNGCPELIEWAGT